MLLLFVCYSRMFSLPPNFIDVLKEYPTLLAQGVYTCFCESFPDSYRQFGEHFKEDLVNLVFEWITG